MLGAGAGALGGIRTRRCEVALDAWSRRGCAGEDIFSNCNTINNDTLITSAASWRGRRTRTACEGCVNGWSEATKHHVLGAGAGELGKTF